MEAARRSEHAPLREHGLEHDEQVEIELGQTHGW
jgi:hypothetical protein